MQSRLDLETFFIFFCLQTALVRQPMLGQVYTVFIDIVYCRMYLRLSTLHSCLRHQERHCFKFIPDKVQTDPDVLIVSLLMGPSIILISL